jgi:hypothetical protein
MDKNRRALVILAVGVGVLLIAFVVPKVFFKGGGESASSDLPRTTPSITTPRVTTTTTSPVKAIPETYDEFSTKNPFQPLVDETAPGSGTAGATGTTLPGSTTGATTTIAGIPGTTVPGAVTATTAPSNAPRTTQRIALLDLFTLNGGLVANVRVNDTVYQNLKPGDVFATSYKVVSLADTCGTFLYGDSSFRLCKGEEVLK